MKLFSAAVLGYAGVPTWNKLNFISRHFLNVFLMVFDYSSSPRAFFFFWQVYIYHSATGRKRRAKPLYVSLAIIFHLNPNWLLKVTTYNLSNCEKKIHRDKQYLNKHETIKY